MTRPRPTLAAGDVVLCEVIFSDYSEVKIRPVVILSTKEYDAGGDDIIIAAITSRTDTPSRYRSVIRGDDPDFAATGLNRDSAVLCSKILTIHVDKLTQRLGHLSESRLGVLRSLVRQALAL